jgi:hypothetical protein
LSALVNLSVARATSLRNNPGVQRVTRSNCATILVALALGSRTFAQADLPVYDDGLQNGFEDWYWMSHSLTNTSPVHSGVYSISVNAANWQGLYLHHAAFDTSPYASLSFWVNGGTNGGQRLQVQVLLNNVNPPADVYYRFTLAPGSWQQITVPLWLLGAADRTNCTGFWIQQTPNGSSGAFYVDDIQFDAKPAAAPAAASASTVTNTVATPGAAPQAEGANWYVIGWCIAGALILIAILLAWLVVMLRRSGLGVPKALIAASPPVALQVGAGAQPQLLTAETLADPQTRALREKMASELTEFAKQSLVQGLYSQRSKLIEAQQKAQQELAELEARLASLHLPVQERIRAYELRIAELEKQLETRDDEMREMIRATLLLIRERLEQEKAGGYDIPRFN